MFNPFSLITKPIELVTKNSARACNLLFVGFVLIPVSFYFGGPRFTADSLNCLTGLLWFSIPFLMVVFSFLSLSWLRFISSLTIASAWIPVCLLSFVVWMPLVDGVDKNSYPFSKLVEAKHVTSCSDECEYRIELQALGPVGKRSTVETHLIPGLKWIEVKDQEIYGLATIEDVLTKLSDLQAKKTLVERNYLHL